MSSSRALRLLNSVEIGTTSSTQLENLLSSSSGRLPELNVLFNVAGQANRIAFSQKTVETLINSSTAMSALVESGVLVNAIAHSPPARSAVKGAGSAVMRRILQSRYNTPEANAQWPQDYNWTRQNLPSLGSGEGGSETATWKALTFGEKYVAVGFDSSAAATSTDGSTWTIRQLPLTLGYTAVAYGGPEGNKRYVTVAKNTSTYIHSDDGIAWVAAQLPKVADWCHLFYRGGKFTAIANGTTEIATSTDGLSWTMQSSNNLFTQTLTVAGGAQGSAVTLSLAGVGTATVPAGITTLNITGRGSAGSDGTATPVSQALTGTGAHVVPKNVTTISITAKGADGTPATTGANTTFTINGTTYTFAGGNGGPATQRTETITLPGTAEINGTYVIAAGGSGNIAYTKPATAVAPVNQALTGNGSHVVPSGVTSITVVGKGGAGSNQSASWVWGNYQVTNGIYPGASPIASSLGEYPPVAANHRNESYVSYFPAGNGGEDLYYRMYWSSTSYTPASSTTGTNTTFTINGTTYTFAGGVGGAATQRTETITLPGTSSLTGTYSIASGGQGNITYSTPGSTVGASASVTVNGTAYTFAGSATTTTPNARTDQITLPGNSAVSFTYSCPAGTLVSATFIASDVTTAATGTGSITIPAGTTSLSINAAGAAGQAATTLAIPNVVGDPNWDAVAYGAGKYVAIRGSNAVALNVAYSIDGLNWTKGTMPGGTTGWTDITFGDGKFVAVRTSASDQVFAYSTDGITWSVVTPTALAVSAAGNWKKVTYGAGKFVAVGSGTSANVLYSTDGINWAAALITGGLAWTSVIYGTDRFVAVSYDAAANGANNTAYSTDGLTWTRSGVTGDTTVRFQSVAYGNGKFLAVGNKQATSPDGVTWTVGGTAKNITNVIYTLNQFIGFSTDVGQAVPIYSTDFGVTWTPSSLGGGVISSGRFTIGAFGGSHLVTIATNAGQIAYSTDGRNFLTSSPQTTGGNTVVTIAGIDYTFSGTTGTSTPAGRIDIVQLDINAPTTVNYVVPATASCTFSYSGGASTQIVNTPVTLASSAYNGANKYVAISYTGNLVAYSAEGVNWTVVTMPANINWKAVDYGNGVFVAVAYDSSIAATSTDGITWSQRAMPTSTKWASIAYDTSGGHVVLSEFSSINATSADGITWTQRVMPTLPTSSIEDGQLTNVPLSGSGSVIIPSGTTSVTINGRGAAGVDEIATPIYGPDGVSWSSNSGLAINSDWKIAFGNGKYVAVKDSSTAAAYSTDGITWTTTTLPTTNTWSVSYCNDKFIAIGKTSATTSIAYSTDGIAWTTATQSVAEVWESVTFGAGKYVAVNSNSANNLGTSSDGITWTRGSINSGSSSWRSVTFGGNKFVAIGSASSNNAAYSTDGTTWTIATISAGGSGNCGVAFGGGKFVAVYSAGTNKILTSTDGITWTPQGAGAVIVTTGGGTGNRPVKFANGKFITYSGAAAPVKLVVSTDGINWVESNGGTDTITKWTDFTYGAGKIVTVGNGATITVGISADIVTGSNVTSPAVAGANATVNINSTGYVFNGSNTSTPPTQRADVVSLNSSASTTVTYSAPTGTAVYLTYVALASSTTPVTPMLPVQTAWCEAAYGNGIFVAIATGGNIAATSTDGVSWTQQSLPVSAQWSHVSFSNGIFVAVSTNGSIGATSADGVTWVQRALPQIETITTGEAVTAPLVNNTGGGSASIPGITGNVMGVAYGNGVTVISGTENEIAYSTNSNTWTKVTIAGVNGGTIAFGAGKFVILPKSGGSFGAYSTDGITWTTVTLPVTSYWKSVTYGNGKFVAVGGSGNTAIYSNNGITWVVSTLVNSLTWASVAAGNGLFVATAENSEVINYSTDGINWLSSTMSTTISWHRSIVYGNGKFVIIGFNTSTVMVSTDAINWTQSSIPGPSGLWTGPSYGGGRFVVIGGDSATKAAYSTDGITWATTTMPLAKDQRCSVYANGYFIAPAQNSTFACSFSVDGTTWSATSPNTSGTLTVPQGVDTISLTGQGAPGVAGTAVNATLTNNQGTSGAVTIPAGVTTLTISGQGNAGTTGASYGIGPTTATWLGLAYTGTRFAAVANNSTATSTDGITWQSLLTAGQSAWTGIAYGGGILVTTGFNTNPPTFQYSTDGGLTWAQRQQSASLSYGNLGKVVYGAGRFIQLLRDNGAGDTTGQALTSTDGIDWSNVNISAGSNARWVSLMFGGGKFIATRHGGTDDRFTYSSDGVNWFGLTYGTIPLTSINVIYGDSIYVLFGLGGVTYWWDGSSASLSGNATLTNTNWTCGAYGAGKFVLSSGAKIAYSTSGKNSWTEITLPGAAPAQVRDLIFANGKFIILSGDGATWVSSDGVNWSYKAPDTTGADTTITVAGTTYTFAGTTNGTYPQLRNETVTLPGTAAVNVTYVRSTAGILSIGYTPVIQGSALIVTVGNTSYTFQGSTTIGPATARTETITGLGDTATTVSYTMKTGKSGTLAYGGLQTTYAHAAWAATAYGNGVTVAVSSTGTHAATTADNGVSWTKRALPANVNAIDLVYGSNLFVAVGGSNKAATSVDGINWSQRSMPDNLTYKTVAFGAGRYVALASGGTAANVCAISPDGVAWSAVTLPIIADWKSIAYKDGLFFAVAANTDKAITSPDGTIWTVRTLPATANWAAVTASDKKFVAIANGSKTGLVSFNGATFNQSGPGSEGIAGSSASSHWNLATFGAGVFVTVAKNSTVAAVSADGINWTPRTLPNDTTWSTLIYANGKFLLIAENTTNGAISADGNTWNPISLPVTQRWSAAAAGPRLFVVVAKDTSVYLTSKDGITWSARNLPETGGWTSVRYGSGRFVVTNDTTNKVCVSSDGINWTMSESASPGLCALTYGNGVFVGLSTNDAGVDVSSDGYNWTQYGLPSISDWAAIRFGNGVFVAIAYNNAIVATSTDGVTWTQRNLPAAANWKQIAYGNGIFLGISDSRLAVTNC